MLRSERASHAPSNVAYPQSGVHVAFLLVSLFLVGLGASAHAQQVNPFVAPLGPATNPAPSDSVVTSLYHPVVAAPKPLRLPPATNSASAAPPVLPASPVLLASTSESRFKPMQVRTPTWLPAVTSSTKQLEGRRLLDQSHHEYSVSAYASAEASAWRALQHFADAIDGIPNRWSETQAGGVKTLTASESLAIAETALRESRDFSGKYGSVDIEAINRFAQCHQTKVLRPEALGYEAVTTSAEAIDRYMNEVRLHLSPIATASMDAAETMDLLAEIYLARNEADSLPNEVSLTLWRAIVQGQPGNPMVASTLGMQLARVGLYSEALWALEHSLSISFDRGTALALAEVSRKLGDAQTSDQLEYAIANQYPSNGQETNRPRVPEVIQLTPEQFASLSQPVMLQNSAVVNEHAMRTPTASASSRVPATFASSRLPKAEGSSRVNGQPSEADIIEPAEVPKTSLLKSFMKRIGGNP